MRLMNNSEHMAVRRATTAQSLRQRLVNHLVNGASTDLAVDQALIETQNFVSPERAQKERELFCDLPILAGFSSEIPESGDAMLFEDLGVPVVLARGEDGVVRAFRNMCLHRGTKLIAPESGRTCHLASSFACPFHAWRYDLQGHLLAIPGQNGFPKVHLGQALMTLCVEEWGGMLFVKLAGDDQNVGLAAHLGAFDEELTLLALEGLVPIQHSELLARTNWKLAMDTYGESYHFGTLHSNTIGQSHYSDVAVFDAFGPHYRMAFASRDLSQLTGIDPDNWPEARFAGVWFLFPNSLFVVGSLSDGAMCVRCFRLFPHQDPGHMRCHITVLAPPEVAADKARVAQEFANDDATSEITLEDYGVAEDAFTNFAHAPLDHRIVIGRNEPAVQHFHRALSDYLLGVQPDP